MKRRFTKTAATAAVAVVLSMGSVSLGTAGVGDIARQSRATAMSQAPHRSNIEGVGDIAGSYRVQGVGDIASHHQASLTRFKIGVVSRFLIEGIVGIFVRLL